LTRHNGYHQHGGSEQRNIGGSWLIEAAKGIGEEASENIAASKAGGWRRNSAGVKAVSWRQLKPSPYERRSELKLI